MLWRLRIIMAGTQVDMAEILEEEVEGEIAVEEAEDFE